MKNFKTMIGKAAIVVAATAFASTASAQFLRTSFTQDVPYAMQINPALTPSHGYVSPLLGPFGITLQSNVFGTTDVSDMMNASDKYFSSNEFIDKLKTDNTMQLNLAWDQLSAGWYSGENFWSFSVGTRIDLGASIPKSLFTFMRDMNGFTDIDWTNNGNGWKFDIAGEELHMQAYQEVGIGFARKIGDRLTVGAKVKALFGLARADFEIEDMSIETPSGINISDLQALDENINLDWSKFTSDDYKKVADLVAIRNRIQGRSHIGIKGTLETNMKGLDWKMKEDDNGQQIMKDGRPIIDKPEMGSFGISGFGLGLDLGASYEVLDNLTVSAALTDLGFISWNKSGAQKIEIGVDDSFNLNVGNDAELFEFAKKVSNEDIVNFDMLQMQETEGEGRTTSLFTTLSIGGEYTLLDDKVSLGVLSTTRFAQPKTLSELTLSGTYNLSHIANIALSYSMIQSAGKSFGIGLKLGPLYVGTDYMFYGNSSQCVNALVGLSIPLAGK